MHILAAISLQQPGRRAPLPDAPGILDKPVPRDVAADPRPLRASPYL
jgi:hypothetical protein